MGDFARKPEGQRFVFRGMKTNAAPDALAPGKYPIAINIRAYTETELRSRPGLVQLFQVGLTDDYITDLRAYTAIQTDDLPRILARTANGSIYLDTGTKLARLADLGGAAGASLIPFRPAASPTPYMYIATGGGFANGDYQKFSAPSATNVVVQQKVGIAEPQTSPDAGISQQLLSVVSRPATTNNAYVSAGTAGTNTPGARVVDQVLAVFPDPANTGMCTIEIGGGTQTAGSVASVVLTNPGSGYGSQPSVIFSGGGGSGAAAYVTFQSQWNGHTYTYTLTGIVLTSGGGGYTSAPTVTLSGGGGTGATAQAGIQTPAQAIEGYQPFMDIIIGATPPGNTYMVQDVFAPLPYPLTIESIYYYSGSSGLCVIVPTNLGSGPGIGDASNYDPLVFGALRRGALVQLNTEVVLILDATLGPNNTLCFEAITIGTHVAGETISGIPAIYIQGVPAVNAAITSPTINFSVTSGLGTLTQSLATSPFQSGNTSFQEDDYIHLSINVGTLASLTEAKILFDVGDGSFTENFYYYTIRPSDLLGAILNTVTQLAAAQTVTQRAAIDEEAAILANNAGSTFSGSQTAGGSGQWTEILFPISQLTRVGNDQTRSLANVNSVQLLINANASTTIEYNSLHVLGGFQPDVGDAGAPYRYRVRPRSKVSGVIGNPSPEPRYGVSPRRQSVLVTLPSATYDPQIDTWDIFRYGGSVTSYRYIGSTPAVPGATFLDDYDDAAAGAGDLLDFDNLEPWPVVDVPNNGVATEVVGTIALVNNIDPDMADYLPGTLVQIGGQNVYTLRSRPTNLSGTTWLLQFLENASSGANLAYNIQEPLIAFGSVPYMWGPDVSGTIFAAGDVMNPGKLYFTKNYAPDAAPSEYNVEITPPSEPLLGGEVVDGLSFVASPMRWWALYPQPDNPAQRYNFVQQPVPRGLIASWGHCTDGKEIFFWAKDGIWGTSSGSLTDEDLSNIFPREGVVGQPYTYNGVVILPPDYSQAPKFRLSYANGYLYAVYPYIGGGGNYAPVLVCDLKRKAWSVDQYPGAVTAIYQTEQQADSGALSLAQRNPVVLLAGVVTSGETQGAVYVQTDLTNDGLAAPVPITCVLAVNEFDGGDVRAPKQWGDWFLDLVPAAATGVNAQPISLGVPLVAATSIPAGTTRQRLPVSVGGTLVSDFLGLFLRWTDDFTQQGVPTTLYLWQPSFDIQPARTSGWKTFGTSFGLRGFGHIQHIALAYVSTQPITLTCTTFDGQDPQPITIPSSGGQYQKALFTLTANKGQLFIFQATSSAPFQIFTDDCEVHVGGWARTGSYQIMKSFGGQERSGAVI